MDTGPKLGSGYWTQIGQWILDPIWAVDTRPNLGSGLCVIHSVQNSAFFVTHILREIDFGECKGSKNAIFGAVNFVNFQPSENVKN